MTIEKNNLRDYLLGRLPEEPAAELDTLLFKDDHLRRQLEQEQDSLIEDFIEQRLSPEEETLFEAQASRSPELQRRIASLHALLRVLEIEASQVSLPRHSFLKRLLVFASPVLAVVLLIVAAVYYRQVRPAAGPKTQPQAISQPHPAPIPSASASSKAPENRLAMVVFLSALNPRGAGSISSFQLPPTPRLISLQIEVHASATSNSDFEVELSKDDQTIARSTHIPLERVGQVNYLTLSIESQDLPPGSYLVRYRPSSDANKFESRQFRAIAYLAQSPDHK